jgi:hypothetical protein
MKLPISPNLYAGRHESFHRFGRMMRRLEEAGRPELDRFEAQGSRSRHRSGPLYRLVAVRRRARECQLIVEWRVTRWVLNPWDEGV